MHFSHLAIKTKIILVSGFCLLGVIIGLVFFSIDHIRQTSYLVDESGTRSLKDGALRYLNAAAKQQADVIQERFVSGNVFTRTVASQIVEMRDQAMKDGLAGNVLRTHLFQLMQAQVNATPEILGIAVAFDKDKLDNADRAAINAPDHAGNEVGRFAAFASSKENFTIPEADLVDDGDATKLWFNCPKKTQKTCVIEPYTYPLNGVPTLMSSIAMPMIDKGQVIGVISIDLTLESLQSLAIQASLSLYEGQSQVTFVSASGIIAGKSNAADALGKALKTVEPVRTTTTIEQARKDGSSVTENTSDGELMIAVPFSPVQGASPWQVIISVPEATLMAPAQELQQTLQQFNAEGIGKQIIIGSSVAIAGLTLMWLLAASISKPIIRVSSMLENIANGEGDLTRRLDFERRDEMGELVGWFNAFLDKLQPIIAQVSKAAGETRSTATQAAAVANETSTGMQQQLREVEQVATAAHEMSATSQDVAKNASMAAGAARDGDGATQSCKEIIEATTGSIQSLAKNMGNAMKEVHQLSDNSEKIGSVLDVIRSIAEQTNLLALNAAIEAARAGETGRGFAVVADEVRHLAKRTQDSVSEIQGVIENLQNGTRAVVNAMVSQHRQADSSAEHALKAVIALARVSQSIEVINDMTIQIASAAEEQSAVSEEVNRNVSAIRDVTELLAEQARESASVSQTLNELANQQQTLMGNFKV
jgi:methyl-accepting chemotaxis protein